MKGGLVWIGSVMEAWFYSNFLTTSCPLARLLGFVCMSHHETETNRRLELSTLLGQTNVTHHPGACVVLSSPTPC